MPHSSMLCVSLLVVCALLRVCRGDLPNFYNDTGYNNVDYGRYVQQSYKSAHAFAPRINFMRSFERCDDGSYIFLSPYGDSVPPGPTILDVRGNLVWMSPKYGRAYNFRVQQYKGESYLTFWAGDDSITGHGSGSYYMLDQHYNEVYNISAGNGMQADQHEFLITPQGTALLTVYLNTTTDLSNVSPVGNATYIWESLFQEIELESGQVLFEWRPSHFFNFNSSYFALNNFGKAEHPWDWYHLNSVDKDEVGNYLVSSRYLRHAAYISGTTGEVIWELGGKNNDFRDLSHGTATTFAGQHDARWANNGTAITLFNNRADFYYNLRAESVGLRISIDTLQMTAKLEAEFRNPAHIQSTSQGSLQTLFNGNVLLGYGYNGVFTEFTAAGEVLCDAYFEPSGRFDSGDVQSYRVMKFNWTGIPLQAPRMVFRQGAFYVSWLGSTEVRGWLVQQSSSTTGSYEEVARIDKDGFETSFRLKNVGKLGRWLRASALDAGGNVLEQTSAMDLDHERALWQEELNAQFWRVASILMVVGIVFMMLASAAFVVWAFFGKQIAEGWGRLKDNDDADGDYDINDDEGEGESCFWECMGCLWDMRPDCVGGGDRREEVDDKQQLLSPRQPQRRRASQESSNFDSDTDVNAG